MFEPSVQSDVNLNITSLLYHTPERGVASMIRLGYVSNLGPGLEGSVDPDEWLVDNAVDASRKYRIDDTLALIRGESVVNEESGYEPTRPDLSKEGLAARGVDLTDSWMLYYGTEFIKLEALFCTGQTGLPDLVSTEATIARAMLIARNHRDRLALLKMWMIVAFNISGHYATDQLWESLDRLEQFDFGERACGKDYMFGAYRKLAQTRIVLESFWVKAFMDIEMVRDHEWSDIAWDEMLCSAHGDECDRPELSDEDKENAGVPVSRMIRDPLKELSRNL